MATRPRRSSASALVGRLASACRPVLGASAAVLLVVAVPQALSAQGVGGPTLEQRGVGIEAGGGVVLPSGGLAAVADPGLSAALGLSAPVGAHVNVRLDGELDLPDRDVAAGPLINVYSGLASLEYVLQQGEPGRAPLRTALSLGGGVSVVEAAEMPAAAPSGATFSESYLTLVAGARLGYPVTSGFVVYLAPRVKWFDLPEADWNRLTQGLGADAPENGWVVPVRAGIRLGL